MQAASFTLLQAKIIFLGGGVETDNYILACCFLFSAMCSSFLISHYTFMIMFVAKIASSSQVSVAIPEVVIVLLQRNKGLTFSWLNPLRPETFCRFFT